MSWIQAGGITQLAESAFFWPILTYLLFPPFSKSVEMTGLPVRRYDDDDQQQPYRRSVGGLVLRVASYCRLLPLPKVAQQ